MEELIARIHTGQRIPIAFETYPDGMPLIKWNHRRGPIATLLLRPKSLASFMAAMFFVDALQERGAGTPHLILPSLPGARQDRINPSGDFLFTALSVANELNSRNFGKIVLVDPHSDVSPALVRRSRVVTAAECINPPAGKYAAVVSPDAGAEKRAGAVAKKLGVPLLHAWKTRDVATGVISGFGMESNSLPFGALVLVVDDMCDAGGTFIGLADVLDGAGLKAHLWVTHGIFTKGTEALLARYGHVYCTDSVAGPREGIIEVNACEKLLMGEAQ